MAVCKECVHNNVCNIKQRFNHPKYALQHIEKYCEHFKDRSRFVELPKIGDTVFELVKINEFGDCRLQELKVTSEIIDTNGPAFEIDLLGERFFLTPEEAEQALAKQNQPDNTPK